MHNNVLTLILHPRHIQKPDFSAKLQTETTAERFHARFCKGYSLLMMTFYRLQPSGDNIYYWQRVSRAMIGTFGVILLSRNAVKHVLTLKYYPRLSFVVIYGVHHMTIHS